MSHSRLAPSDAGRWLYCPGSVSMQEAFPETERSEDSMEGDATHWVCSETLQGRGADSFIGRKAPNGVVITEEMVGAATVYVEHVCSLVEGHGTLGAIVEEPVSIERIHPECWGTPDTRYYSTTNKVLHIPDFKYGWGIVEPEDNEQCICYGIGALDELAKKLKIKPTLLDQEIEVHLHIVQPRAPHRLGPIRTRKMRGSDLRSWANRLQGAAIEALGENARCVSGKHCKNCDALHVCEAGQKVAYNAIDLVGSSTPDLLDNDAAVSEYLMLKRAEAAIKNRLSAREGNLIAKIRSGEHVPGLVLEHGQGRAAWNRPAGEVIALGDIMKKDLRVPDAILTPAKAIAKGLSKEIVGAYSSTGVTGLKLIPAEKSFAAMSFRSVP